MTAASAPAPPRPLPATRRPGFAAARLLRLELRHNAMPWMLPVAVALFWLTTYRKTMAMPPLWNLRAASMQSGVVVAFVCPVAGAAAWMGSREARRRTADLVTITAQQAAWGGPLWWPAAVGAASLPVMSALGFAAGALVPSRFTAPLVAIAAFFALVLSTELIHGSQSYWQVSPVVTGPWDTGPDAGVATFYPYLPDLPIAQVMFLIGLTIAVLGALALPRGSGGRSLRAAAAAITGAGLVAAGTAVGLAGTGKLDDHGMIAIPALHNAASDRPIRFTPVCSHTAIPVCLNPAYASYLAPTAAALKPVLTEIAGLPGAPARVSQGAATYEQGAGNGVGIGLAGPNMSGTPPVYHMLLPDQLLGPTLTTSEFASEVRSTIGPDVVANVIGDGPGASQAQHAVAAALMMAAGLPVHGPAPRTAVTANSLLEPGTPAFAAAQRFAALPSPARHAWLMRHLAELRAGQITLAQLP